MGRSDQYGVGRERLRAFVVSFLFSAEGAGARPWGVVRSRSSRSEECRVSRGWSSRRGRRRAHRRDRRRACSHSDRGLLGKSRAPPDGGRGHGSKTAELAVAERIDRTIAPDRLARIDPAQIRHRVDAGEDADQSPAFCDQDRADAALEHRGQCRGERFVGAHDIGVLGHRLFDLDAGDVQAVYRIEEPEIALAHDSCDAAAFHHRQVAHAVSAHDPVRDIERWSGLTDTGFLLMTSPIVAGQAAVRWAVVCAVVCMVVSCSSCERPD